jgi:hypothetical protein
VVTKPRHWIILWFSAKPTDNFTNELSKIHFNIIFPPAHSSLKVSYHAITQPECLCTSCNTTHIILRILITLSTIGSEVPHYVYYVNILSDFNAKVETDEIFEPTIGNESLHEASSDNGIGVVNFATSRNLIWTCFKIIGRLENVRLLKKSVRDRRNMLPEERIN